MKTTDMNRLLIEATVRHTLERLTEAPEREIRNLIDMGMAFSKGRFQKHIFATAQTMLQNPNSAYYTLVKQAANHISHERLLTFGMNLGYESCTKGAGTIRAIEANEGFNIPWALSLSLDHTSVMAHLNDYNTLLDQSTALGIYTTLIFVNDGLLASLPLIKNHPNVAFALFLNGKSLTETSLDALKDVNNVLIYVANDENAPAACDALYHAHMLYGIYHLYNEETHQSIMTDSWLESLIKYHPTSVLLVSSDDCPLHVSKSVFDFVSKERENQRYPFIFMDLRHDLQRIDQIISDDLCMVGFDKKGTLHTLNGCSKDSMHNVFEHPLKDIFNDALKK